MSRATRDLAARDAATRNGTAPVTGGDWLSKISRFVAMGDSFTAGRGCRPGEPWPEILAESLAVAGQRIALTNLAVDGATSKSVVDQLDEAVALEPDLVSVCCGGNDVLFSVRPDVEAYALRMSRIVERLKARVPGVQIITATVPETWEFFDMGPRTRKRMAWGMGGVNASIREIAKQHDLICLDVSTHPELLDPQNFMEDGLHPSPRGHMLTAIEFEHLLRERWDASGEGDR